MAPKTNGQWQANVTKQLDELKEDHKELRRIVSETGDEMREKFHDLELEFVKMQTWNKSKTRNQSAIFGTMGAGGILSIYEIAKAFL